MRLLWWSGVTSAVCVGLAVAGLLGPRSLLAGQRVDVFKADSVWHGTCGQTDTKSSYPMILFVKHRQDDAFEGVTYYPTLGNALLKVKGRIDKNGKMMFREDKLLYGETYDKDRVVVTGITYTAKLDKKGLTGGAEITEVTNPKTNETVRLKEAAKVTFSLKLGE